MAGAADQGPNPFPIAMPWWRRKGC